MYSYADTFEQPVEEKFRDRPITIPLLTQRDYLPWIAELTPVIQERMRKNAPPAAKPIERANWLTDADNLELTPGDLRSQVFRAGGTIKVLTLALKKAKLSDEETNEFIDSRPSGANVVLAVRVSGLFSREELAEMYPKREKKDDKNPNESPPAGE